MKKEILNQFKGGTLVKKCVIGATEIHPDLLPGGHRNPYQLENAIKSGGTVFLHISLGLNSLPGNCDRLKILVLNTPLSCDMIVPT